MAPGLATKIGDIFVDLGADSDIHERHGNRQELLQHLRNFFVVPDFVEPRSNDGYNGIREMCLIADCSLASSCWLQYVFVFLCWIVC